MFKSLLCGTFVLSIALAARANAGFSAITTSQADAGLPAVELVAGRHRHAADAAVEPAPPIGDVAGRYAVMREKRDTGCMLTLDTERAAAGNRAQLAPGCRDQGIVVFDPAAWQVVKGDLVLTARAGHKARLAKDGDSAWKKDPAEGKPLGLKKL